MDQLVLSIGLTACLWCDCHHEDKAPRWGGGVTVKAGDGGSGGWGERREKHGSIYTTMCQMDSQWGFVV